LIHHAWRPFARKPHARQTSSRPTKRGDVMNVLPVSARETCRLVPSDKLSRFRHLFASAAIGLRLVAVFPRNLSGSARWKRGSGTATSNVLVNVSSPGSRSGTGTNARAHAQGQPILSLEITYLGLFLGKWGVSPFPSIHQIPPVAVFSVSASDTNHHPQGNWPRLTSFLVGGLSWLSLHRCWVKA